MAGDMTDKRDLLCHFLAALAYRTQKALRDAPADFGSYRAGVDVRTPAALVRHMTSVLGYARTFFTGGTYWPGELPTLHEEIVRFHETVEDLAAHIRRATTFPANMSPEQLLQGPLADAMTHAGQLAMLRRWSGAPVPPENFVFAAITPERLGVDQAPPAAPDAEWPERPSTTRPEKSDREGA